MATKRKSKKKAGALPAKMIEVFKDHQKKATGNKNAWNWGLIKRIKKKRPNEIYGAEGFDSKGSAQRAARAHNKSVKVPYLMVDKETNKFFV